MTYEKESLFLLTSAPTSCFAPSCNPALVMIEGVPLVRHVDGLYSSREGDRGVQFDQSNVVRIWAVVLETWVLFKKLYEKNQTYNRFKQYRNIKI